MPSCDDVIQRHFTYSFEYEFPDGGRLSWQQREARFQQFLLDFPSKCQHPIEIESIAGSAHTYPWVKVTSMDWVTVRKFVGAVRRRLKGKPGYHFEEDYSHVEQKTSS